MAIFITLLTPVVAEASVYTKHKVQIDKLGREIQKEINLGGDDLVKGVTNTKQDKAEWEAAEKRLRAGKYGERYHYRFKRRFSTKAKAYGFLDTVVGKKYRYLELKDYAVSKKAPYYIYAHATEGNKFKLDYYARNKGKMVKKLNKMYRTELLPYKNKSAALKIAIAASVVDSFFTYKTLKYEGILPYTINTRKGVCDDYSFMMDYFLRKLGFEAKIVGTHQKFTSDSNYTYHAINAVKVNDGWFYIDTTNMDGAGEKNKYPVIKDEDNYWFSYDLNLVAFPGWEIRCVY